MSSHARLAPSAANRWLNCPAAPRLELAAEKDAGVTIADISGAAQKGTDAHTWLEDCLRLGSHPTFYRPPEAEGLTQDFLDAVVLAYDWVIDEFGPRSGRQLWIEKRVDIATAIGRNQTDLSGTADLIGYEPDNGGTLHIADFKSGVGPVEADSVQLKLYGLGALRWLQKPVSRVRLTIIQPRYGHKDGPIRHHDMPVAELVNEGVGFAQAAAKTDQHDSVATPGAWCRWCGARATCAALFEFNKGVFERGLESLSIAEQDMVGNDQVKWILDHAEQIQAWVNSVQRAALTRMLSGNQIPGYKLANARKHRRWRSEQDATRFLNQLDIEPTRVVEKLITPAEAERQIRIKLGCKAQEAKAQIADKVIAESHPKIVADSDSRKALEPTGAKQAVLEDALSERDFDVFD